MTTLFWWKPTKPLRSLAVETRWHWRAWSALLASGVPSNFGDELSPLALKELTGEHLEWAPLKSADVVGVGSILNGALKRTPLPLVFGSGLRGDAGVEAVADPARFTLVRGSLTREALGLPASTPLGDPGLVIREIYPVGASKRHLGKPLFIPHFAMLNWPEGRMVVRSLRSAGWEIMLPNETPRAIALAVAHASAVLTTSLHAMVFAHSYGTPVSLLRWEAPRVEPRFKYLDYLSALGAPLVDTTLTDVLTDGSSSVVSNAEGATSLVASNLDAVLDGLYAAGSRLSLN